MAELGKLLTRGWARLLFVALPAVCMFTSMAYGQAILAPGGRTLFNKTILFRSFVQVRRLSVKSNGRDTESVQIIPAAVVYGIAPGWNITAVVPYISNGNSGFGDARFFAKYDGLYKRNVPGGLTRLSGEFGIQTPTGSNRFSTGAFAFIGDLVFEIARNQKFLIADIEYQVETYIDKGSRVGNRLGFDVSTAYLWLPASRLFRHGLFAVVELNGQVQQRARTEFGVVNDSGGFTLFLSPGLQYFLLPNLIFDFSVPIPIVKDLNGNQPEPLAGILFGFRFAL